MTIGIGAYGPNAGLAVFEALRAAEKIGQGAIGGFATYAAIGREGSLHQHQTQRGGSSTLFIQGESTGTPPPPPVAEAVAAAVISSGPDRPDPLTQFLVADPVRGLVTGHRLPNGPSIDGKPLNLEALDLLRTGKSAQDAVDQVIGRNPEADVGLIAVTPRGSVYSRNSLRVQRRPDLGHARRELPERSIVVEVLHNAIRPFPALAQLAAAVAIEVMAGPPIADGWITIPAGIPLELGKDNAVHCTDDLVATKVVTTDPLMVEGRQVCAAIYLHSMIYCAGAPLGVTLFEPIVTVEDGTIIEMSGQKEVRMSFRRA